MSRLVLSVLGVCLLSVTPSVLLAEEKLDLAAWAKKSQARYAHGLYMGGKKAGYSLEELKLGKHEGKSVLTVTSQQYIATLYDGEKSTKDETTVCHYELTGDGSLLYAKVTRKEDGKILIREMKRHEKGMRISTRQNGRMLTRDVTIPKDNLATTRALEAWLAGPRKPGEKFTKFSIGWEAEEIDQQEVYVYKKKSTAKVDGKDRGTHLVDIEIDGGKFVAEVFSDGRPLNGVLGGLLSIKLEKEAEAKKVEGVPVDLMTASCILLDKDLGLARTVDELKLRLTNLGDFEIPANHRQIVTKEKDTVLLTVKRDFRQAKASPLTEADVKANLRSTPRLQCDQKAVQTQSKKIVGDEKDALKKARLLRTWVYDTLKKSYADNAETALEVLDNKAGDCTEHSLIFVALARAAGIPAREVGGLAFVKSDGKPMMGWHAWAEIHDGHQWVSIDPTWNQVYVDGTHIKLSEGEKDLAWANVAGKLKIAVSEVTKRK